MPQPMELLLSCDLIGKDLVYSPGGEDPGLHDEG